MRSLAGLIVGSLSMLAGCDCAYGGAGCWLPAGVGLCSPTIQVDVGTPLEIVYGDDTGLHPVDHVRVAFVSDPSVLSVWTGDGPGQLVVLGHQVGHAAVALEIAGWDQRGVIPFKITAEPPPVCDVEYGEPAFEIQLSE